MRLNKIAKPHLDAGNLNCEYFINISLYDARSNVTVAEIRFLFFKQHYSSSALFCGKKLTLRLEAKLMMDRWRSLFLCAGVSSGREAALSTAADKTIK